MKLNSPLSLSFVVALKQGSFVAVVGILGASAVIPVEAGCKSIKC